MNKIQKARKMMKDILDEDRGLKETYVANIAMLLYDRRNAKYHIKEERDSIANEVLNLIFS